MAGYLFLISKDEAEALDACMQTGIYSTIINPPNGTWGRPYESTILII